MSITRTAKGTFHAEDTDVGVSYFEKTSVAIASGATLVVIVGSSSGDGENAAAPSSVSWNGHSLTKQVDRVDGLGEIGVSIWTYENAVAGTGTIAVAFGPQLFEVQAVAIEVTGCDASSVDKTASASGTSTTPSSGNTATTALANELLIGGIARADIGFGGSWSGAFSAGQSLVGSVQMSLQEGYRIVSATGAYSAAKTGESSAIWSAAVLTLEEATAPQTSAPGAIDIPVSIPSATIVSGLATLTPNPVAIAATPLSPTLVPGAVSIAAEPIVIGVSIPTNDDVVDTVQAERDPTTIASQEFIVIRPTSPAALGDGDAATFVQAEVHPGTANPAGGTIRVTGTVMADPVIPDETTISYLVFRAIAWRFDNVAAPPYHTNFRMGWEVGANAAEAAIVNESGFPIWATKVIREDEDGLDVGDSVDPDYFVTTGQIATQPNGQPWDVPAVKALANVSVAYDYANTTEWAEVEVAEIIVEVYGPIGSAPDVIEVSHIIGAPIRIQTKLSSVP